MKPHIGILFHFYSQPVIVLPATTDTVCMQYFNLCRITRKYFCTFCILDLHFRLKHTYYITAELAIYVKPCFKTKLVIKAACSKCANLGECLKAICVHLKK